MLKQGCLNIQLFPANISLLKCINLWLDR